ncbi:MAG TPA: hypothetical protein VGL42_16845 [Opitutaceae bacterium]|jgi:hypothetical protein
MKRTITLMLGCLSSLLLAAGFARASERVDPLSVQVGPKVIDGTVHEIPYSIPCYENGGSYEGDGPSWSGDNDGRDDPPTFPIAQR